MKYAFSEVKRRLPALPMLPAVLACCWFLTSSANANGSTPPPDFHALDADTNGQIDANEYRSSGLTPSLFSEHDANGDRALTLQEFSTLLQELRAGQRQGGPHPPRG